MALPTQPPLGTDSSIMAGDRGWAVYALQCALRDLGQPLAQDGIFGDQTRRALLTWQTAAKLAADAKAGPLTQRAMSWALGAKVLGLPAGLMRGMIDGESGGMLGTVNWKGSGPAGCDCGLVQLRVYGPPFGAAEMARAFDGLRAARHAASVVIGRARSFALHARVSARSDRDEYAWRLAVLAHNWPAAASTLARNGAISDPDGRAGWIPRDAAGRSLVRFPDGTPVETRMQWCEFYALGGRHGAGHITRHVTGWPALPAS